jgi:hypothetical protein
LSCTSDDIDCGYAHSEPPTRGEHLLNEAVSCAAEDLFKVRLYPENACWLISSVCDSMGRLARRPRGVESLGRGPRDLMLAAINDARNSLLAVRPPLSIAVLENGLHSLALLTIDLTDRASASARKRPQALTNT